jgi:hypothetical protein
MILINNTTNNTVTGYISAGGGEKIFKKRNEKKISGRGQSSTRGIDSSPLTVWTLDSNAKRSTENNLTTWTH